MVVARSPTTIAGIFHFEAAEFHGPAASHISTLLMDRSDMVYTLPEEKRKAMETFRFSGDHIELNRLLKATGLCDTGGRANRAIEEGLVSVDGTVEYRKRCKIRDGQTVAFGDRTVRAVGPESGSSES